MNLENNYNVDKELEQIYDLTKDFIEYHKKALPLCAAENVLSKFSNIPLAMGFQERYIMNNTYSFNLNDNFIGCEKLYPYYKKIAAICERIFGAKYTDPRPFTGMHCIDMITKLLCSPGDKMMILGKDWGGHASVRPVVERLGVEVFEAPYCIENFDLNYDEVNNIIKEENIKFILLAPSDLIKPLNVDKIDTSNCTLLYDCSQIMGLIAAGTISNPLRTMNNIVMFGGTHKTFPGPASGLIMTNNLELHEKMETEINPKHLRNSQMHQKISLLFSLIEFEKYGKEYMNHIVKCSNYIGNKLKEFGHDIVTINGKVSFTHEIFMRCDEEKMNTIYTNAYKCGVTLNKKNKKLFNGYGIRLGTQEIARYNWQDSTLDLVAKIINLISEKDADIKYVKQLICQLPDKKVSFTFNDEVVNKFYDLLD